MHESRSLRHRWGVSAAVVALLASSFVAGISPAAAATTRTAAWPASWTKPMATLNVSTNYGAYSAGCPNANKTHGYTWYLNAPDRKQHLGLDLAAAAGTDVRAIGDGRVLYAGNLWGSTWKGVVLVEHMATNGNKFTAVYGHITIGVRPGTTSTWRPGDVVRANNLIGKVATTGTGAHLHFGIAPGTQTSVVGTSGPTSGSGNCVSNAAGTTNPETYLAARKHAPLSGSIVGYKNSNGSVTSWRVTTVSGVLRRYWIPTTAVYSCLRNKGVVDRGPMPPRFLDQLPDRNGYHTTC